MHPSRHDDREKKFKEIAWPFMADLLRVAILLTRNHGEAEDLVQETFLKAWRAFDTFETETDAKAWLMMILRHTQIDHVRSGNRRVRCFELSENANASKPCEADSGELDRRWANPQKMMEDFSDERLVRALKRLPEEILWTVLLVHVEQLDHRQAAAILRIPVGTVKSRAHRGRRMLMEQLDQQASTRCHCCGVPTEQCAADAACSALAPCPTICIP